MERLSLVHRHLTSNEAKQEKKELSDQLLTEWRGTCLKIILNRPKMYNAVGDILQRGLLNAVEEANRSARVYILKSTLAGKVFCAGADLKEVIKMYMHDLAEEGYVQFYKVMYTIARAKPTTIAFWDGIVMGGGVGISIHANIKIATENTVFAMPEAKLGYFTNVGGSYFLPRIKKNIGLFLALTAYSLKGKEACQVGVADYFVKSKDLLALEADIERLAQIPTVSEGLIREIIEKYAENVPRVYKEEDLIAELFNGETLFEVLEKLKKKSEENEIVRKWYKDIMQCSPISHFYNFGLFKRGKRLSLHEALSMEAYLAARVNQTDLFEGIRAVIIEKGAKPDWSVTFEDLKMQKESDYFPEKIKLIDYDGYQLRASFYDLEK